MTLIQHPQRGLVCYPPLHTVIDKKQGSDRNSKLPGDSNVGPVLRATDNGDGRRLGDQAVSCFLGRGDLCRKTDKCIY
jgi:hypothetical protein